MSKSQFSHSGLPKWQLDLIKKYPLIYLEKDENIKKFDINATVNLRFGFEFDEGWAKLVDEFSQISSDLVGELRNNKVDCYIHSAIFKEKYSKLIWQGDALLPYPFDELFYALVDKLESDSGYVCEVCGKYGKCCNNGGWLKTLCKNHAKKLGYEYKE